MIVDEINVTIAELKKYNLAIGWLDIGDQVTNIQALQVARNLTDFWSYELNYLYDIPILYDNSLDNLLVNACDKNYDYLLVLSLGIDFKDELTFFKAILNYIKNFKFSFVGHVLDRKELYYKVHPQTILININWYKENQQPIFGAESTENWETNEPIRSIENYHDDYTPYSIATGNKKRTYNGKLLGWNFVNIALQSSYPIIIFDKNIRISKSYLYPEDSTNWTKQFTSLIAKIINTNVFVINTEKINELITKKHYDLDYCFITAAGLNSIIIPFLLNMKQKSKIVIFDLNKESLSFSKCLVNNYKGQNLKDFFNLYNIECLDDLTENNNHLQDLLKNGLLDYIENVVPTLEYEYLNLNVLYEKDWKHYCINEKNVYLNLSNIFTFLPTARIFSLKDRIEIHNLFFKNVLTSSGNYIIDYRGFYLGDKQLLTPNDVINVEIPNQLKIFPWNV